MPTLTVLILFTCINRLLSSNSVARSNSFTIEWIDFNILTCAVPTTMNVSLFSCIIPNYTQIDDLACFPSTTTEFQPNVCPSVARTTTYSSSLVNVTDHYLSITGRSSTSKTTSSDTSTPYSSIAHAAITTVAGITTANATAISHTDQTLISSSARTTRTSATTAAVLTGVTTQYLSATSTTNQYVSTMLIKSATQTSAAGPDRTTHISVFATAVVNTTISTAASTVKGTTVLSPSTTVSATTANSYNCSEDNIGPFCNISSDACTMSQPCLNAATCYPNNTLPLGYRCQCQSGYTGYDCQNDERICKENTCWHNGRCIEVNSTISDDRGMTFYCECRSGYTGTYCELTINLCGNITCANKGRCQTINMAWKCTCLDPSLFYGDYCQFQTNFLLVRKALSRSFASIAITIIVLTCSFVVLMDILKYVFHIDPVKAERRRYRKRQEERKRAPKSSSPKVAIRFQYIP